MAYHLYTTRGLVVRLETTGENSRRCSIFTEHLGLIHAHVQAGRGSASKLKMHTQYLTLGLYTVVRGKGGYRLTGAQADEQLVYTLPLAKQQVAARISALIERLMVHDHPEPNIFAIVQSLVQCLHDTSLNDADVRSLETVSVLNILHTLGYIDNVSGFNEFLSPLFDCAQVRLFTAHVPAAVKSINTALRSSGL